MRERDIEAYLVKRVKALGGEVRKVQWVGRSHAPDRIVMLPQRWHGPYQYAALTGWAELKAPGVAARPGQRREHERMRAMGQHVVVIDSFEGVDELLYSGRVR